MMPYHSWAANSVDLGGGTNLKNDLQVDGSPIGLGHKNSYPPNTDAVQEVVVSQNSVDAESGHSAGGLISMTLKSGTNDWHGTGFYLGRYPWLNAEADRTRLQQQRHAPAHVWAARSGNAIIKNKLFNFFSLEYWKVGYPSSYVTTVPTAAGARRRFLARSCNIDGGVKTIYDPYTTKLNAGHRRGHPHSVRREHDPAEPFRPAVGVAACQEFWDPNSPGDNITGVNNFKVGYIETYNYYNFSDRVDYNINDKLESLRPHRPVSHRRPRPERHAQPTRKLYVPTGTSARRPRRSPATQSGPSTPARW